MSGVGKPDALAQSLDLGVEEFPASPAQRGRETARGSGGGASTLLLKRNG
jgi:hypothetical protein